MPSPPEAGKVADGRFTRLRRARTEMITLYVIKSDKDYRYVGITKDLKDRLKRHNNQRNKSTKGYKNYKIILTEEYKTYAEARAREKFLKSGVGRKFLDTVK